MSYKEQLDELNADVDAWDALSTNSGDFYLIFKDESLKDAMKEYTKINDTAMGHKTVAEAITEGTVYGQNAPYYVINSELKVVFDSEASK